MAYRFTRTSSQYLTAPITSPPVTKDSNGWGVTISCWVRNNLVTTAQAFVSISFSGNATRHTLGCAGGSVFFTTQNTLKSYAAESASNTMIEGIWTHICGRVNAASEPSSGFRYLFINGQRYDSNGGFAPFAHTVNTITIGTRQNPTSGLFAEADIAEVGVWSDSLEIDEIASLAKGFACKNIRPQSLELYFPLLSNSNNIVRSESMTAVNGPVVSTHPRVYV